MNTHKDRAAEVISNTLAPLLGQSPGGPDPLDYAIAEALADAGLLMPDLNSETIDRAAAALHYAHDPHSHWDELDDSEKARWRADSVTALEAALNLDIIALAQGVIDEIEADYARDTNKEAA